LKQGTIVNPVRYEGDHPFGLISAKRSGTSISNRSSNDSEEENKQLLIDQATGHAFGGFSI
jgi:hypothetical protein